MKLLHLIGNGSDISLGLKTSYSDFYEYYLKQPIPDDNKDAIQQFKDSINQYIKEKDSARINWSDAEVAIGEYASIFWSGTDHPVYSACIDDFQNNLINYLQKESDRVLFEPSQDEAYTFLHDFLTPEERLANQIKLKFKQFCNSDRLDIVNVITFNYTTIFENIFKDSIKYTDKTVLKDAKIIHIHGTLEDNPVLGVNDKSQVKNLHFEKEGFDFARIVKPIFNDRCLNTRNGECENLIKSADVISIYGMSTGITDRKWFEMIGQQMVQNDKMAILYFPYDKEKVITRTNGYKLYEWCEEYKEKLINAIGIKKNKAEEVKNRIFVNINKRLFYCPKAKSMEEISDGLSNAIKRF